MLLNYLVLLAALLLFRHLYYRLTAGRGCRWVLVGLLVFLLSNQVTKAFFWTTHQQMLTLLVPLVLLWVVLKLRESARWRARLPALALLGGGLALSYGSFVLGLPVLLYGLWLERQRLGTWRLLGAAVALTSLYALPTGLWVLLLKLRGVAYYNHEAEAYGQVVWLRAALRQPLPDFLRLVAGNVGRFLLTLPAVAPFLAAALGLGLLPARRPQSFRPPLPALGGLLLLLFVFLAGLGFYRERLTFALVPLLLLVVAVALAQRPAHRWVPWVVGAAAPGLAHRAGAELRSLFLMRWLPGAHFLNQQLQAKSGAVRGESAAGQRGAGQHGREVGRHNLVLY